MDKLTFKEFITLYKKDNNLIYYKDKNDYSILYYVNDDIFKWIVENTNIDINYVNKYFHTIFNWVVSKKHLNKIKVLLENGVIYDNYDIDNYRISPPNFYLSNDTFNLDEKFLFYCQNKLFDDAKILINDIDINYLNEYGVSAFSWCCYHNNYSLCETILKMNFINYMYKDINNNIPIFYITDKSMYKLQKDILFTNKIIETDDKIKIYNCEEIINKYKINEKILNGGTYGNVINIKDKITNKSLILKLFTDCEQNIINSSTFLEISILKKLNEYSKYYIVNFFGIYKKEKCYYLILEELNYNIHEIKKIWKKYLNDDDLLKIYNILFYKISDCIYFIHSLGIVHSDLSTGNIMIDKYNNVKLIDFGLSKYLTIAPNLNTVKDLIGTIPPPKNKTFKINNKLYEFNINRNSYNFDIFSLGEIIINLFLNTDDIIYYIIDGILYMDKYNNNVLTKVKNFNIDSTLFKLLENMLKINSFDRFSSIDILNDKYFNNKTPVKKEYIKLNKYKIYNQDLYISYKNNDIVYNKYELAYINEIYNNYRNDIFRPTCEISYSEVIMLFDYEYNKIYNLSIDNMINLLYIYKLYYNKFIDKLQIFIIVCYYIMCLQFELKIPSVMYKTVVNNMDILDYILSDIENFNIKFIVLYIEYYIIKLRILNIIKDDDLKQYIIDNILEFYIVNNMNISTIDNIVLNIIKQYLIYYDLTIPDFLSYIL